MNSKHTQKPTPPVPTHRHHKIANDIVKLLFTDEGYVPPRRAVRLMQMHEGPAYISPRTEVHGSGWCKSAAQARIAQILANHRV